VLAGEKNGKHLQRGSFDDFWNRLHSSMPQSGVTGRYWNSTLARRDLRRTRPADLRGSLQRRAIEDASTRVPQAAASNILNALFERVSFW
jgi:hypothetical protein